MQFSRGHSFFFLHLDGDRQGACGKKGHEWQRFGWSRSLIGGDSAVEGILAHVVCALTTQPLGHPLSQAFLSSAMSCPLNMNSLSSLQPQAYKLKIVVCFFSPATYTHTYMLRYCINSVHVLSQQTFRGYTLRNAEFE